MSSLLWINVSALLVAFAAVVTSSLLTRRALRLNQNASHLPIVLDALKAQRTAEFTRKEFRVCEELPKHDVDLGFSGLPEPLRGDAVEIACYYQHLSYLAEYGLADWDFIAVQTTFRLLRTWECIEPYVYAERLFRGSNSSYLNSYEVFAGKVKELDVELATRRLYRRGQRRRELR